MSGSSGTKDAIKEEALLIGKESLRFINKTIDVANIGMDLGSKAAKQIGNVSIDGSTKVAEESFILALEFAEFEDEEFVVDIYNSYAQLLSQNEEVAKANKIIEKGLKRFPENEVLFNQLALNFISNSLFDQATLKVLNFSVAVLKSPFKY